MKFYIAFFLSLFFISVSAQERIPADISDIQINLNILQPSLSLEARIADKQSLVFYGGLTTLFQNDFNDDLVVSLNPYIQGEFRNYYPRKKVKKELRPNSGNYVGLVAGYNFGSIADNSGRETFDDSNAFYLGPVWGIQRNYKSGIHLGLSLGAGFITGKNTNFDFHGVGQFELGFVISSKKKE